MAPHFDDGGHMVAQAWQPRLSEGIERVLGIERDDLPLLWDCDFLHGERASDGDERYVLCEINVSSVAPFPDSAIEPLVGAAIARVEAARRRRA